MNLPGTEYGVLMHTYIYIFFYVPYLHNHLYIQPHSMDACAIKPHMAHMCASESGIENISEKKNTHLDKRFLYVEKRWATYDFS